MRFDEGFKLFTGVLSPDYAETIMTNETFDSNLETLYDDVAGDVKEGFRLHRKSCLELGYTGPFLGAQLDLTTVADEEYITFSVSYIPPGSSELVRVGLATRALPGTHTAADITPWIQNVGEKMWVHQYGSRFVELCPAAAVRVANINNTGNTEQYVRNRQQSSINCARKLFYVSCCLVADIQIMS